MLVSFSARGPLRHHWYAVARSDDVRDGPLGVELLKERLVLWRGPSGAVIAAPDKCTHRWSELHRGSVQDGCLVCPSHGWTFGDGGRCVRVRLRDEIPDDAHLTTFACDERFDLVWVRLGASETEIPVVPVDDDAGFRRAPVATTTWKAPAPRIVEALLEQASTSHTAARCDLPFTYRRARHGADGLRQEHLVTCAPVDAMTSTVSTLVWTNDPACPAEDLLQAELVAAAPIRQAVEAVTGMFELHEGTAGDGDSGAASAWRRALLATISTPV